MTERTQLRRAAAILLALVCLGWATCLVALATGCGPGLQQTRSTYQAEVDRCLANEQAIVGRTGTTVDEDAAALAAERARCDAALLGIRHQCGRACR
jgi:hypothetical protein